ncbi:MAG: branched-chain amino acid aminotransferase [Oscillospiraceae bacterium]|nr:branched-chain amino acid aminotransferase [Oscillospiraceae bacterium]
MQILLKRTTEPKSKPAPNNLGFGNYFTDHMFIMNYKDGKGWVNPRIVPYAPFQLDPAAMCLHYGQEVFEGMKAYYGSDKKVRLFRPLENIRRLNTSSDRLCIPQLDEDFTLHAIEELVQLDRDWIPTADGTSLYIRPFIIAADPFLGVRAASEYIFAVILSPVGAYYPEGLSPVKIFVEQDYVRAVQGGTGAAKAGGNYAATLKAQQAAKARGCAQVLWLDGIERKFVEEVGTSNAFFAIGDEIITPALSGSILPGITRKSCIELLRANGHTVVERAISLDEVLAAARAGTLKEAFATGTAAVISPMGTLLCGDEEIIINGNETGEIAQWLYNELTGIQWGRVKDNFEWTREVH